MHELHISEAKKPRSFHADDFCIWQRALPRCRPLSRVAWAQTYPTRPVRLIATTAAGGTQDILARLIGQWLSERLGQPFIIENRSGGGGNIATEAVVKSPPDGYTLLLIGAANTDQRDALRQAQFQFHPRHRAGRGHHPHAPCHGGTSIRSGQNTFPSSSPMPRPTRARSTWRQAATEARLMCPANCSR